MWFWYVPGRTTLVTTGFFCATLMIKCYTGGGRLSPWHPWARSGCNGPVEDKMDYGQVNQTHGGVLPHPMTGNALTLFEWLMPV